MADTSQLPGVPGLDEYLVMKRYVQDQAQREQQQGLQQQFIQQRAALGDRPTEQQLVDVAARNINDPRAILQYGQASLDRQEATKARLLMSHELISQRISANEQRASEVAARLKDKKDQDVILNSYKQQNIELANHLGDVREELGRMGIQISQQNADTRRQLADQAAQGKTDKSVQQLGTALERANLPEADATLRAAESALSKRPDLASYISGPMSLFPDAALPKEVTDARQAFQKVFNITLKNRSGAAVTPPEFERLKQEFGTGAWKKPEQLRAGLEQARKIISDHYRAIAAGYGQEALGGYNENLRQTGGTPLLESQGITGPAQATYPIATNPKTGEKLIFKDGKWQKP